MKKGVKRAAVKRSARVKVAVVAIAATITGGFFLLSVNGKNGFQVPAYYAQRVIDGDTFVTTEQQIIRIQSTEAPELGECGGSEAKEALEKLILGKPLYIKIMYRDPYQRLISLVYTSDTFINKAMLDGGYSYHARSIPGEIGQQLKDAGTQAREQQKGIFGISCTQSVNPNNPACSIKGNDRGDKIYYVPTCGVYENVEVQLHLGDKWFCTEGEAQKAGFRKPSQCP